MANPQSESTAPVSAASPPPADRLLIIRLGAMGDVVRTLPAAESLRELFPGAHLTWLVEPASAGVVDAAGIVDETLIFPRADLVEAFRAGDGLSLFRQVGSFVRKLRRRRFEIVLDFHGILKSGLLARLSGAPLRYGYGRGVAREFAEVFVNRHASLRDAHVSRFERNAALVAALAPNSSKRAGSATEHGGSARRLRPTLETTSLAEARLSARLRVSGREEERGFVLLHPGTSLGARHKRYPPSGWAQVARGLFEVGIEVWIASGVSRDERMLVDRIVRESQGAVRTAPETRSFDDLLALLARASVFASADTGPLHAASLAGVPVVQLLGPTDPVQNEPWRGTPSRRVHVPLSCSPCRRGCASAACMAVLPPTAVVDAILSLHQEAAQSEARIEQTP
jgi:ADP-heptose:LPS heptosyltransferase